jgi:hypothetical protein
VVKFSISGSNTLNRFHLKPSAALRTDSIWEAVICSGPDIQSAISSDLVWFSFRVDLSSWCIGGSIRIGAIISAAKTNHPMPADLLNYFTTNKILKSMHQDKILIVNR